MARKWSEFIAERTPPERIARNKALAHIEFLEVQLKELRKMAGKSQAEVAAVMNRTQSELSRMESRADHRLSTLREYIEALGGELDIVARFGGKTMKLKGV